MVRDVPVDIDLEVEWNGRRFLVIDTGGIDIAERQYEEFFNGGWNRVTPYAIPVSIVGMISTARLRT